MTDIDALARETISMTDPANLLAVLVQFGPSSDGAVERDLAAAIDRLRTALAEAERERDTLANDLDAERAAREYVEWERDEARQQYTAARIGLDEQNIRAHQQRERAEAAEARLSALSAKVERMREAANAMVGAWRDHRRMTLTEYETWLAKMENAVTALRAALTEEPSAP